MKKFDKLDIQPAVVVVIQIKNKKKNHQRQIEDEE